MAISVGWVDFNEKKPFGDGTIIGGDNIPHSRIRHTAVLAVKAGTASPEQMQLVHDADLWYANAMNARGE